MSARRMTLLIAALAGLFVLGVALAVAGLLALGDPGLLVVCIVAGVAGLAAAGLSFLAVHAVAALDGAPGHATAPPQATRIAQPSAVRPVRVQSLPVAELPAPYVAAVMKGLRASRASMGAGEQR